MKKLRVAAHLCGWPKEIVQDRRRVMEIVRGAGYDGVEASAPTRPTSWWSWPPSPPSTGCTW